MLGIQALGPLAPRRLAAARCAEAPEPLRPEASDAAGDGSGNGSDGKTPCRGDERDRTGDRTREREAWLALLTTPGVGPVTFASLIETFGTAREAIRAAESGDAREFRDRLRAAGPDEDEPLRAPADLGRRIAEHLDEADAIAARVRSLGLGLLTLADDEYPFRLRAIEFPPPVLFVLGSAQSMNVPRAVAVVGTRRPTDAGRRTAGWIASAVGRRGAAVVSGLATGIDGAAHASAVSDSAVTLGVLGGGHARLFPRAHERLAAAIVACGGAVISELPPDTSPSRGTFPRRNRIISGLADATVVVEAGPRSGALITAGWALEQGRECFLVPGPIDAPASIGCNTFLRLFAGQARIVSGIPELLEDLHLADDGDGGHPGVSTSASAAPGRRGGVPQGRRAVMATLGEVEATVAGCIAKESMTLDQLAARTQLPVSTVLSTLTLLELKGLVLSAFGRYRASGALGAWSGQGSR